ncbi:phosphatase PAP2 family protein [Pseudomonas schmalbachii]|uniref:undecaprenyl-diphosphate phosphatase n=1 Tax=Pseudomonas schmalbachii TaxID=2816993 RepID=A0ABS3TJK1_9PSED|nr:phosphatase PAP2 family protein [Pseudomonas schmalbachii]MBO3273816.1 phosphatase PAP2 family protein [Pseudomonas schmalbachii]
MYELLHNLDWVLPLRSPGLTHVANGFTWLGYGTFLLLAIPLGLWAWNKGTFFRLLVLIAVSAWLNALFKDYFQDPRPPLELRMDDRVGESYGLPSGHTQMAVVLWLWLAYEVRRLWFWLVCSVICLGVSLSRLYLAAHDVEDVLVGAALGGVTLLVFARIKDWALWNKANLALPVGLAVLAGVASVALWPGKAPEYVPMFVGLLVGAGLGFRIERQTIDFGVEVAVWKRALAAVIGSVAFLLFQKGLKAVGAQLPLEPLYWQALRGLSMGLFITLVMPWVLVKMRLLSRHAGETAAPAKVAAVG